MKRNTSYGARKIERPERPSRISYWTWAMIVVSVSALTLYTCAVGR